MLGLHTYTFVSGVLGIKLQGFMYAKQAVYQMSCVPSPPLAFLRSEVTAAVFPRREEQRWDTVTRNCVVNEKLCMLVRWEAYL